jgi:hypothetical protein
MSNENLLSRRLALGSLALIACATVVTPAFLTSTKAFAEDTEAPDSAETADSTEATDTAETETADAPETNDDDAGTVVAPSATAIAPASESGAPLSSKKKKHFKK